jgi:hypothetical protein
MPLSRRLTQSPNDLCQRTLQCLPNLIKVARILNCLEVAFAATSRPIRRSQDEVAHNPVSGTSLCKPAHPK